MDNIAIGLRKEGVRAVRVGRPDKINRILEEITCLTRSLAKFTSSSSWIDMCSLGAAATGWSACWTRKKRK